MQPCPGEPICKGEVDLQCGLLAKGTFVYNRKGLMGFGKLGERNADLVPGMGSAIALVQAGGWLAGNGSSGKELCCREKLLGSCSLKQIKIEAVH